MSNTQKKPFCLLEIILVGVLGAAALIAGVILLDPLVNNMLATLLPWFHSR
jgi:hypothetical protein